MGWHGSLGTNKWLCITPCGKRIELRTAKNMVVHHLWNYFTDVLECSRPSVLKSGRERLKVENDLLKERIKHLEDQLYRMRRRSSGMSRQNTLGLPVPMPIVPWKHKDESDKW